MGFVAAFFAALASAGSAIAAAVGGAQALFGLILNVTLSLIQMAMQPKERKPEQTQSVFRQSAMPRFTHMGYDKVGGAVLLLQVYKRTLYLVTCHGEGPVAYEQFVIDGRPIQYRFADGVITTEPYFDAENNESTIRIWAKPGSARGTAYDTLSAEMPFLYGPDHRFDGLATSLVRGAARAPQYQALFYPNLWPVVQAIGRFATPFDPRTGKSVFTSNLVLHLRHYLTSKDGGNIPGWMLDDPDWKAAANVADEILQTKDGGTVRRWEGASNWKHTERTGDVIQRMLLPMDGRIYIKPATGKIGIKVAGKWKTPKVHIRDKDIIQHTIRAGANPMQEAEEVVIKWIDPLSDFGERTTEPWINKKVRYLNRQTGGSTKNHTFEVYAVRTNNHGRRLAKIISAKLNPDYQGKITTSLAGLRAIDEQYIYVDLEDYGPEPWPVGGIDIPMEVNSWFKRGLTIEMQLSSVDPACFEFDPATEEGDAPVIPVTAPPDQLVDVEDFRVAVKRTGSQVRISLSVKTPPQVDHSDEDKPKDTENAQILTEFQWAVANTGVWNPVAGPTELPRAEITTDKEEGPWDVRARHIGTTGQPSSWKIVEDIDYEESATAPAVPTGIAVFADSATTTRLVLTTPKSTNFQGVVIYRNTTNNAKTAARVDTRYLAPGRGYKLIVETPAGTWYYFVASVNWTGTESARIPALHNPIKFEV